MQQRIAIHIQQQLEEDIAIGARRLLRKGHPVLGRHVGIGYDTVLPPYFYPNSTHCHLSRKNHSKRTTSGPTRFRLGMLLFLLLSSVGGLPAVAPIPRTTLCYAECHDASTKYPILVSRLHSHGGETVPQLTGKRKWPKGSTNCRGTQIGSFLPRL